LSLYSLYDLLTIKFGLTMTETSRGAGKWANAGVPHKGWTCVDIEDLGEPSATCEMCETQEIRYVHYMSHPEYEGQIGAGCVCAGRMEEDYEGARRRETALKNATSRKSRWLGRTWRTSRAGHPYINADCYNVVVYERSTPPLPSWGFRVTNRKTGYMLNSRRPYPTEDAAKLRAFDAIIWLKERGH
jgi:hypothetical protein